MAESLNVEQCCSPSYGQSDQHHASGRDREAGSSLDSDDEWDSFGQDIELEKSNVLLLGPTGM